MQKRRRKKERQAKLTHVMPFKGKTGQRTAFQMSLLHYCVQYKFPQTNFVLQNLPNIVYVHLPREAR